MFDRVYLINLEHRTDRLQTFRKRQRDKGWALPDPIIFKAVDGYKVPMPKTFLTGDQEIDGGGWGCLLSHCAILKDCIKNNVETALILEDDVCWRKDAWTKLNTFMNKVPKDWDQLMVGGQHFVLPLKVNPSVKKVIHAERTHAYAINKSVMKSLLNLWENSKAHIDWVLGMKWQKNHNVYCPSKFIFGQYGGVSDINGDLWLGNYWNKFYPSLINISNNRKVA